MRHMKQIQIRQSDKFIDCRRIPHVMRRKYLIIMIYYVNDMDMHDFKSYVYKFIRKKCYKQIRNGRYRNYAFIKVPQDTNGRNMRKFFLIKNRGGCNGKLESIVYFTVFHCI